MARFADESSSRFEHPYQTWSCSSTIEHEDEGTKFVHGLRFDHRVREVEWYNSSVWVYVSDRSFKDGKVVRNNVENMLVKHKHVRSLRDWLNIHFPLTQQEIDELVPKKETSYE